MSERLRVIVLGYVVRFPLGGMSWHYLQYAMGLAELGHDVYFLEESESHEWPCWDPRTGLSATDPTYGLEFASSALAQVGLGDRWAYFDRHQDRWHGPCADRMRGLCRSADVLVNISGWEAGPWVDDIPVRVFIDTDPVFEQVRQLTVPERAELAAKHNVFFSFGHNLGRPDCSVPDDGLPWQPTRQPMVLSAWPVVSPPEGALLTTVMQWDSYRTRKYAGVIYGMKSTSFEPYLDLPEHAGKVFELALGTKKAPRDMLTAKGWRLRNPLEVTRSMSSYQEYIQGSAGEFSIAKHGYVIANSGWFSERSAGYLASGRPVVAQNTGFSHWLETGQGLLAFSSPEEAVAAVEEVRADPARHQAAARELAAAYFASDVVLTSLLERATSQERGLSAAAGSTTAAEELT